MTRSEILFISDLHLSTERPEKLAQYRDLLRGPARRAAALYILGDLLEQFWAGNDDRSAPNPEIIEELAALADSGTSVSMMRGNRELVLDRGFERLAHCTVLPDATVIDLHGERVLLMHGDALCTRDTWYQRFRRLMESSAGRGLFLALPYAVRIFLARGLRPLMRRSTAYKAPEIIDVDPAAVVEFMRVNKVRLLIHGHTHRPGIYPVALDGAGGQRIVLGDWYADQDRILVCSAAEKKLLSVRDYLLAVVT